MILINDIRDIRIRNILPGILANQIMMQVASHRKSKAIVIHQCRTETMNVCRLKIRIANNISISRSLYPIRIQRIKRRSLYVSGVLPDKHPFLHPVKRIGYIHIGEEIKIITRDAIAPVICSRVFGSKSSNKRPLVNISRQRSICSSNILMATCKCV